jgi:hypothetical protein
MPKLNLTRRPKQVKSTSRVNNVNTINSNNANANVMLMSNDGLITTSSSSQPGLTRISVRRNEDNFKRPQGQNYDDEEDDKDIKKSPETRPIVKLTDKIETPLARQKKLQMAESNKESISTRSATTTFSIVSEQQQQSAPTNKQMRQNTFIVCLKINKSLFNQIFKKPNGVETRKQNMMDPFNEDSVMSAELQMELSQDKTLDVPEIWGLSNLDIKPERVHFKQFADIDEECLNERLNTRTINDKKIHLVLASFKNKTWPSSSPYACWNCTEHFENAPVGIPTVAMSDNYEDTYYLEGNFCSFNCAASTSSGVDSGLLIVFFNITRRSAY